MSHATDPNQNGNNGNGSGDPDIEIVVDPIDEDQYLEVLPDDEVELNYGNADDALELPEDKPEDKN